MIQLIVKGSASEALDAATVRGLRARVVRERPTETTLEIEEKWSIVAAKWFCERPTLDAKKEFPAGTLLYYRDVT